MTILGRGDLSPRRKRRNPRRQLATIVAVLVVAGAGYGGYHLFSGGSSGSTMALLPCPSVAPSQPAALKPPLVVRNATLVTGLAADVAHDLRQRHFHIASVGNTLFRGSGVATVKYSADLVTTAQLVAAQFNGATLEEVDGTNVLEVDVGPKFEALVSVDEAQSAERSILESASPIASPTASPTCAVSSTSPTP